MEVVTLYKVEEELYEVEVKLYEVVEEGGKLYPRIGYFSWPVFWWR